MTVLEFLRKILRRVNLPLGAVSEFLTKLMTKISQSAASSLFANSVAISKWEHLTTQFSTVIQMSLKRKGAVTGLP